ncbi:DUF2158 domain-containing protein [Flavobacterium sp. HSC-61S13]|uniref:DUF2158 domain-containing protein n=1 Tax=Flavobacterium sp. HSC-61S13 TaxID=2910963 RepID=UPI00209FE2BA|nr:DUF2158 domain-containing protein [Flavobacterium sp. HSC-61S13]MCP1996500.1 uncharacterized protein YodC (DUF2158 family) [Flavobacterium sp. HSC-61S13]
MDIKLGDIVVLKSGGPKMTIESIKGDQVNVVYYNEEKKIFEKLRLMTSSVIKKK